MHQDGGHRPPPPIQSGFDDRTLGRGIGVGLQLQNLRLQEHHFQQVFDANPFLGRDLDEDGLTSPLFGDEPVIRQLLAHLTHIRIRFVDFVDGDQDGDLGILGMVERLNRLGHHPIIACDHQHHDIGHLRPSGPHGGKGFMAGSVQEDHSPMVQLNLVSTDVLSDLPMLGGNDVGMPNGIEEGGLSMVHMAHDGHHRRPGIEPGLLLLCLSLQSAFKRNNLRPVYPNLEPMGSSPPRNRWSD